MPKIKYLKAKPLGNKLTKLPDYVEIQGTIYEKIEVETSSIDIDLDDDIAFALKNLVKDGGYVNRQEAIRDAIRFYLKNKPLGDTLDKIDNKDEDATPE